MRYARVAFNELKPGTIDELNRKAEETLVPELQRTPGFVSYQAAKIDDRSLVSFSIWETREAAEVAQRLGADWLKQYAKDALVLSRPYIAEVTIDVSALPAEAHPVF